MAVQRRAMRTLVRISTSSPAAGPASTRTDGGCLRCVFRVSIAYTAAPDPAFCGSSSKTHAKNQPRLAWAGRRIEEFAGFRLVSSTGYRLESQINAIIRLRIASSTVHSDIVGEGGC